MILNYLRVSLRSIWKNKLFSFINIAGLALGMAFSLLILLWVQSELSVDAFHEHQSRLYAVYTRLYNDSGIDANYETPGIMADEIKRVVPEVEYAVSVQGDEERAAFRVGDKIQQLVGISASPDLFKMFTYPLLQGTPQTALNSPVSIAVSEKMAKQFFGSAAEALGKTIQYKDERYFNITAVFSDIPANSSMHFDYVINWYTFLENNAWAKRWDNSGPLTYLMLRSDANPLLVEKKIRHFRDIYTKNNRNISRTEYALQKFQEVYLHSDFKDGKVDGGRIEYVNLFSLIAFFVLLIACINFMNLTTAYSVKRAREIGIRKVIGAARPALIKQFIGESLFLTIVAVVGALVLLVFLLPIFNYITQKQISYPFAKPSFWLELGILTLITGLISGSYPALFLSSFQPIKVLKGNARIGPQAAWFRKGLVIFQFVLSVILIICTIVVSKQINFIQKKDIGYDRRNLIQIPLEGALASKYQLLKDEALKIPGVQMISRSSHNPISLNSSTGSIDWEGKNPEVKQPFSQVYVGYDFARTIKLKLLEGREFSKEYPTDSVSYIINETALKKMGYKDPIGRTITVRFRRGTIIGVLKDFHFKSLKEEIQPLVLLFGEENDRGNLLVRVQAGKAQEALAGLEALYRELNPNFPFTYSISELEYQKLYRNEQIVGNLANAFAFLGIFISCLGLLGLAIFTAEQRTKEISVRKVLGASVGSLLALLSKEFLILIFIAFAIASPIAWFAAYKWLLGFAYHTSIDWWIFVLAGAVVVIITFLTVSVQSLKAALINPINTLRSQ